MKGRFILYLRSRGISYSIVNNNILTFQYSNINFLFEYNVDDSSFFRFIVPDIDNEGTITDDTRKKVCDISASYKVGKCLIISNNQVWLTAETFIFSKENVEPMFQRMITLLCQMLEDYRSHE